MSTGCPFCRQGTDEVYTLVPLNPVTTGHLLVIPRKHVSDFSEDPETTAKVMRYAAEIVKEHGLQNVNLITSKGTDATQSVFHFHVHIVPRSRGDGLKLPWTGQNK